MIWEECMEEFVKLLRERMPALQWKRQESMKLHTTFGIGGEADLFAMPEIGELPELLSLAREENMPVTVIGNGSNLLVSDLGIRGLVIEIGRQMEEVTVEETTLLAQAGASLSKAAQVAAAAGLGGLEFAAGIPGSVGGAVTMNAGAYGGEMKDVLTKVRVLTKDGKSRWLSVEELDLSYRHSCVPKMEYLVVEAVFALEKRPESDIRMTMAELAKKRLEKQPLEYPSAGSTFKRPEGYFAGKLIMDAGLRGYQVGDAQVAQKHCGFVINKGHATAGEVYQLICHVQNSVWEQFGVRLEPEVKFLGEFEKNGQ